MAMIQTDPKTDLQNKSCLSGAISKFICGSPRTCFWRMMQRERERDVNVAEIFSGVGSIEAAAEEKGLKAVSFDKLQDASQNVLCRSGLVQCMFLIAVVINGLVWLAPIANGLPQIHWGMCPFHSLLLAMKWV